MLITLKQQWLSHQPLLRMGFIIEYTTWYDCCSNGVWQYRFVSYSMVLIFGAAHIIAIDIDAHKLDIATSLGAHQTINSKKENLEKFIENDYANQIDLAIESSGAKVTIGQILTLPKKGGEVVLLGIPYDDIDILLRSF